MTGDNKARGGGGAAYFGADRVNLSCTKFMESSLTLNYLND